MHFEQVSLLDDLIITDITAFGAEIRCCERRQRRPGKPNSNRRFQRRSLIVGITTARFLVYLMIANLADYLLLQASGRFRPGGFGDSEFNIVSMADIIAVQLQALVEAPSTWCFGSTSS